jgi:hypothetical protein
MPSCDGSVWISPKLGPFPADNIFDVACIRHLYLCTALHFTCRSHWPRGLRRRSSAARLLRLWVRIPPGAWMSICCECSVLSGRGLCDGLISRPEETYRLWRVVVCDQETSKTRRLKPATGLGKIQPQWVVTVGQQTKTNKQTTALHYTTSCVTSRTDCTSTSTCNYQYLRSVRRLIAYFRLSMTRCMWVSVTSLRG